MTRIGSWLRRGAIGLAVLAGSIVLLRCLRPTPAPGSLADLAHQAHTRELARRAPLRQVTHGATTADNAFEHYATAMRTWDAVRRELGIGHFTWDSGKARVRVGDPEWRTLAGDELVAFRRSIAPVLQSLQRGAHAADTSPRSRHDSSPLQLRWLLDTEIAVRLHEGDGDGAVALWLDGKTFALDVGDLPGRPDSESVWTDAAFATLSPTATSLLDAGLTVLDRRLDRPADAAAAIANYVIPLTDGYYTLADWSAKEVLFAWEFGFDPTARHLASFESLFAQLHRLEPVASSGRARAAQWADFLAAAEGLANGTYMSGHAAETARDDDWRRLRLLTNCRQIRIGLAARRGLPLPELLDPFSGTQFRVERTATELIVHAEAPPHGPGPARWSLPAAAALPMPGR
ncbi:MAG: hypothetical protein MUC36_10135 [Planctomycetes bacterium]|jgi:hypothetical protein|nr:hypothetical protein [Planctomycetota bacterium]